MQEKINSNLHLGAFQLILARLKKFGINKSGTRVVVSLINVGIRSLQAVLSQSRLVFIFTDATSYHLKLIYISRPFMVIFLRAWTFLYLQKVIIPYRTSPRKL